MAGLSATRSISALIMREVATAYGRTPGGYLWAVAEPVAAVVLLAAIFSVAFDSPPLGRDFALFYAGGYLPFAFYADLTQKIGAALRYSRPMMAYPAIAWIDPLVARFALNTLVHVVVIAGVLPAFLYLAGSRPADPATIVLAMTMAACLGLSIGALNAYLFERWPIWERVWSILNRPTFLLSGVLFLPDQVPQPYRDWLWLNPLAHVITTMRVGLYEGYLPRGWNPLIPFVFAAIILVFGLLLLRRDGSELMWRR